MPRPPARKHTTDDASSSETMPVLPEELWRRCATCFSESVTVSPDSIRFANASTVA
jgi:hypothetical protein